MRSTLHLAIFLVTAWGCTPSAPALPVLLPVDYYAPTLAAATLAVSKSNNPDPVTPVNPSGKCENCNGTGKIPARPDHPEDLTKQTCPVCKGSGTTTSTTLETPVGLVPPNEASPSLNFVSEGQSGEHPIPRQGEDTKQPPADNYTKINYTPVEQALEEAKQTGKPIWIHVTDLKSCRECIRLERQVLNQKGVIKASREFVCVQLLWDHPWRPGLIGETAVPIDCFGTVDEWKNLKRYLCAKTVPGYVTQLEKVQGK